jgi:choline dehydrogenase-like flavoprotein
MTGQAVHPVRALSGRRRLDRRFVQAGTCRTAALLMLLGLGSCDVGPSTVCVTPHTTCKLDQAYAQTATDCHCGDEKGLAVTR